MYFGELGVNNYIARSNWPCFFDTAGYHDNHTALIHNPYLYSLCLVNDI